MRKPILITIISFILIVTLAPVSYALSDSQLLAIQALLDDAARISGVPGMSVGIIFEDEEIYFSTGYANRESGMLASEDTIYELASVSKAFTGVGILLLEEQGLLSMDDSVAKYLPWFTLKYQGMPVAMQSFTLNHFLYHTSGLTNARHMQSIPEGSTQDMLHKTVEVLVNAELEFPPGNQYTYGTVNYDVLGLVIEVVTGQSYESFMMEQVFYPLGLYNTFLYKEEAQATRQLAQGYRTSFSRTTPYDAPEYAGNKPAGYIMSNTVDMMRWMKIQMGVIQNIPEIFRTVITKSHQGNLSVPPDSDGMYYAAGWMVDAEQTMIEHSGGNPNFATEVIIFPHEQTAISLLTNGAHTNIELVMGIKEILAGNLEQSYQLSSIQLSDIVMSSTTIVFSILALLFLILGLRRKKRNKHRLSTKMRMFITIVWLVVTIAMWAMCWFFPMFNGYDWPTLLVWQPYSLLTVLISLALLFSSITWFIYAGS